MARIFTYRTGEERVMIGRGRHVPRYSHPVFGVPSSNLKIGFNFSVPKFLEASLGAIAKANITVKVMPKFSTGLPGGVDKDGFNYLRDGNYWKRRLSDALNEEKNWLFPALNKDFNNAAEIVSEKLRVAFRNSYNNNWEPISGGRELRRKLITSMGSKAPKLSNSQILGTDAYHRDIFDNAISSFKVLTKDTNKEGYISNCVFGFDNFKDMRHSDFDRWRSSFMAPGEVALSILGLDIKSGERVSSRGKKMMVPLAFERNREIRYTSPKTGNTKVYGTKPADAVLKDGKFYYFTSKNVKAGSTDNPSQHLGSGGVLVNFYPDIFDRGKYVQNPDNQIKTRPVFWTQNKAGDIRFPLTVLNEIKNLGLVKR